MSDKQREKHLAQYWQGPITRVECQKVFAEQAVVLQALRAQCMTLDLVVNYLVEKSGIPQEEIKTWCEEEIKRRIECQKKESALISTEQSGTGNLSSTDVENTLTESALVTA